MFSEAKETENATKILGCFDGNFVIRLCDHDSFSVLTPEPCSLNLSTPSSDRQPGRTCGFPTAHVFDRGSFFVFPSLIHWGLVLFRQLAPSIFFSFFDL
jgi:hypothetical protein